MYGETELGEQSRVIDARGVLHPRAASLAAGGLLLANAVLLLVYICVDYRALFHSDAAAKSLIAAEILRTGHFFPPDWYHVNGDLMVVFGHVLLLPFVGWVENSYALYAFSGVVSAALLLSALWYASAIVLDQRWVRLAFVALVAGGISPIMAESLFGQVSYGAVLFLVLLVILSAYNALTATSPRRRIAWLVMVCIVATLGYWANPQRAAASYTVPLCAALVAWQSLKTTARTRAIVVLGTHFAGAVIGYLVHATVLASVRNVDGAGSARWLDFTDMSRNARGAVEGILAHYGGLPVPGDPVMSVAGLLAAARLGAAAVLALAVAISVVRLLGAPRDGQRFLAGFTASSLAVFLFLHLTSTVPDMSDPVSVARYLVPSLVLGLLVLTAALAERKCVSLGGLLAAGALAIAITAPWVSRVVVPPARDEVRQALVGELRENGLHYGYASYWNAGALTVLGAGKPAVRQIQIVNGMPIPRQHLASEYWYSPDAWQGPTFLLLLESEAKQVDWPRLAETMGSEPRHLSMHGFDVAIFPNNLANRLAGWDAKLDRPLDLHLGEDSPRTAGRHETSPSRIVTEAGQVGYLHFGPYQPLVPGRYLARFTVESGSTMHLDIASNGGAKVLASRSLAPGPKRTVELPFDVVGGPASVEARVRVDGEAAAALYAIILERR